MIENKSAESENETIFYFRVTADLKLIKKKIKGQFFCNM